MFLHIRAALLVQLLLATSLQLRAQLPDFSRVDLPTHSDPTWVIATDLNQDNLLDMVVSNTVLYEEYLTVFLRDTIQGYVMKGDMMIPGSGVLSFSCGDFDEDGKSDLLVPCSLSDSVFIYRGSGDGWFAEPEGLWAGNNPEPATVGDFNQDGHQDFVASSWTTGNLNVMLGNGDGTFEGPFSYFVLGGPNYSCIGDFNEDGNPDIAVANSTFNDIALLLGEGNGSFIIGETIDVLYDAYTLASGDFNEDGHLDLACGTHQSLSILHGDGSGSFERVQDFDTVNHFKWVGISDFNGDGHDDVSICIKDLSSVVIFPGDGSGLFNEYLTLSVGNTPQSLFLADLKGDGHPDLLTACRDTDAVTVLGNDLDRNLLLGPMEVTSAVGWESVIVHVNLSAENVTESPFDGDIWLTISVGDSSEILVPSYMVGWLSNPLPFHFNPLEHKTLPPIEIRLPSTLPGEPVLRIRLGEYQTLLYSIECLEIPLRLSPPSG